MPAMGLAAPSFDIVALAASAGGLRALTEVLAALPAEFPAPLVVVQHLDPRHRSLMAEILGRRTAIKVTQAEEGQRLEPGIAYVAPLLLATASSRIARSLRACCAAERAAAPGALRSTPARRS